MREMMTTMQRQALIEQAQAEMTTNSLNAKTDQHIPESPSTDKSAQIR